MRRSPLFASSRTQREREGSSDRGVVRIALMRGTVHLVTAADCLALRPPLQAMLDRWFQGAYAKRLQGLDLDAVAELGRRLVDEQPRSNAELGRQLLERWPDRHRGVLCNLVRTALPLVQVPPRAVWGRSGQTTVTTAQAWLGHPLATDATPDAMVLRYFGAARLDVEPFIRLSAQDRSAIEAEGARLLAFAAADAHTHDVRVVAS